MVDSTVLGWVIVCVAIVTVVDVGPVKRLFFVNLVYIIST
jgi:hypothetical protein